MQRSRRAFLATAGSAATALAGCVGSGGTGGSASTGSASTGSGNRSSARNGSNPGNAGKASLLLNWKPGGLHAPYYAAKAEGFYEAEGLALTGIESGQGSDFSAKQVALGNTPLAVTSGDQVVNVASRGLSPLAVGVVMQRNPVLVFSTPETFGTELSSPEQLAGKTVGTGPGMVKALTELLLKGAGVRESVTLVDTGFDTVQQLLAGKVDAVGGSFSDAVDAEHQGYETNSIPAASVVPAYGHVIATQREFANENSKTVRAFLRASARGAVWATENPKRAISHLVDAVPELETSREVELDEWRRMSSTYMVSDAVRQQGWGWSERRSWNATEKALRGAGLLGGSVDLPSTWTNEYLDTDYQFIGSYAERVSETGPGTANESSGTTGTANTTSTGSR